MATHNIERNSLDAHVSICEERYRNLADRLESTDQRLAKLEIMLTEIHAALREHQLGQNEKWIWLRDVVIVGLLAVTGWMANLLWN